MSDTIQALARALDADIQGVNAVSHNVANIGTPGFQRVRAVPDFASAIGIRQQVEIGDGPLKRTERMLDLALRGEGFFVVERDGQRLLTRSGGFTRDPEGRLVNAMGDRVASDAGDGWIVPGGDLRVDADGVVWSGSDRIARLAVVDVGEPARLEPVTGGYRYDGEYAPWSGSVQQGAIEQSNVDAAAQTLHLIELTRHAESVQRVVSAYDRMLDTGINRIGDN